MAEDQDVCAGCAGGRAAGCAGGRAGGRAGWDCGRAGCAGVRGRATGVTGRGGRPKPPRAGMVPAADQELVGGRRTPGLGVVTPGESFAAFFLLAGSF